jgi:putative two-component system response regulator
MDERGKILIVDDSATNVDILCRILCKEYALDTAENGLECLAKVATFHPQVVLLDIVMPGMNGLEACRKIKSSAEGPSIQVILVSSKNTHEDRVQGRDAMADDYVVKPFDHEDLMSKVHLHFRLGDTQRQLMDSQKQLRACADEFESRVAACAKQSLAAQDVTLYALAYIADSSDSTTGNHLHRTNQYAKLLAQELAEHGAYAPSIDEKFIEDLGRACPLHDLGKMAVSDAILQKPCRLTPDEFEEMKNHVHIGAEALKRTRDRVGMGTFLDMAIDIALYHHERFDGTGYCAGLQGEEIPLAARIVSLAEVFDAMTSRLAYKPPFNPHNARKFIARESGMQFDPVVVDAFQARFDDFLGVKSQTEEYDTEEILCEEAPHPLVLI